MKNTLKTVDCETDCLALSPFPRHPPHHSTYSRVQSHHSTRQAIHNPPNRPHLKPISNKSIKNKIKNISNPKTFIKFAITKNLDLKSNPQNFSIMDLTNIIIRPPITYYLKSNKIVKPTFNILYFRIQ